jgi:uncharacterized protein YndB with AHSA1/START domain
MAEKNNSNEIKLIRIYDVPIKTVWDAWTQDDQVAQWWGPRGYTLTIHSHDLRTGGLWHYTMHSPDGTDYVNKSRYLEVIPLSKMVYDQGGNDDQKPMFRVTVLFSEANGKTQMDMTMALPSAEAAENTKKFIKKANGNSTWDRLAEYLEKESSHKEIFVINRSFQTPLETLFKAWTDPEHLSRWVPPAGFTMKYLKADIRPGGECFYAITDSTGQHTMYGKSQYLEVAPYHRIVYAQQFSDEKGNTVRHPMSPTWPETMLTTVQLTPEGPNQTRVTLSWVPSEGSTAPEIETFSQARTGMTGGWTGSFDKLESHLAGLPAGAR